MADAKPFRAADHRSAPSSLVPENAELTPPHPEPPRAPASRDAAADTASGTSDTMDSSDLRDLGTHLARVMERDGYHPIIVFGTNASGKTSLLLSLFAKLFNDPRLRTGLTLRDPLLGGASRVGAQLHKEALHTFELKTQHFLQGEKIPRTSFAAPFFIPVEFGPGDGKPAVRFAFLESNGEWYRPLSPEEAARQGRAYPELREELEDFISTYEGPITFLYLVPYTQMEVYAARDEQLDAAEVGGASLAIVGVLQAYHRKRRGRRGEDRHLMLVTKWDAHSVQKPGRGADDLDDDPVAVFDFVNKRYAPAYAAYTGLIPPSQAKVNAYCSGIITERGLRPAGPDDEKAMIGAYPIRLWRWLYGNALAAAGLPEQDPFPSAPPAPGIVQTWRRLLGLVSGR